MFKLASLLVLSLASLACAPAPLEYAFSFEGPESDRADIELALAEWNSCGVVRAWLDPRGTPISPGEVGEGRAGVTHRTNGEADYIRYAPGAAWVVRHELGHALGLIEHASAPQDLMYHSMPATAHVSEADCERLRGR